LRHGEIGLTIAGSEGICAVSSKRRAEPGLPMISRRPPVKSLVWKRSIWIGHRKTSVTLEMPFWDGLKEIANERGLTVAVLVAEIKADLGKGNLSSACRLFVLRHYRDQPNKRSDRR
jgi:predicted DNA-binding ribbon-helix-helix protein